MANYLADPTVLAEYKRLSMAKKMARNEYHRCLTTSAPDVERHAAERKCSAAADAFEAFLKSI